MRSLKLLAVSAVVAVTAACEAPPPAPPAPPGDPDPTAASWQMNEGPGATRLVDSGPKGLHGRIGDDVQTGVRFDGATAHRFSFVLPDAPPANPERLNTVPHHDLLNPGDDAFAVTIRLRTTSPSGNIVQKGQSGVPGGFWKLEMEDRRVYCLFRGGSGQQRGTWSLSTTQVDDGEWHTIRCERNPDGAAMYIDGQLQSRNPGWSGNVANNWILSIGGKSSCNQQTVGCDYFSGDIDWIRIENDRVLK